MTDSHWCYTPIRAPSRPFHHQSTRLLDSYDALPAKQRLDSQTKTSVGGCRHADVGNRPLSHERTCGRAEEPGLGESQCQRRRSADAGLIGLAARCIKTGRQIDGQNWCGLSVRSLDQPRAGAARWTTETEPEQSIDDQVSLWERRRSHDV